MQPEAGPLSSSDFERGLAFAFSHARLLIFLVVLGGAAGLGTSYLVTPLFTADAVLIPSDEMLGLNENGVMGGLGGLASLVGAGAEGSKQSEAIETLKSRELTMSFIAENNLLPILFADRWNATSKTWKVNSLGRVPTLVDGFSVFDKRIRIVNENRKTGLIAFSITWKDPILAKKWADGLVKAANLRLRAQAIDRSQRNIDYLKRASEETSVLEVKLSIYKLMESEIKKQMLATGNEQYAFRIVDPPVVPERKASPVRSLFVLMGAIFIPAAWLVFRKVRSLISKYRAGG